MKKKVVCLILIAVNLLLLLSACVKDETAPPKFEIKNYEKPADLPDYALSIEWIKGDGKTTEFLPYRPTMILFNGVSEEGVKEDLTLPDIYFYDSTSLTNGVLGSKAQSMDRNLAYYWYRMGFNVGIFHYENFAFDSPSDINKRVYDKNAMSYKNVDGELKTSSVINYNLTEAFVMEWLKLLKAKPIAGSTASYLMEVRFIGNSSGVNLALSAADYLYDLFADGNADGFFVPDRISILNPDFDNKTINSQVTHKVNTTVSSVLSYNEKLVTNLSGRGVVFDMVENDSQYYLSYESPYSGAILISDEDAEEKEYRLENSGDIKLYNNIVNATAYLSFTETYSKNIYPEKYARLDRAVRDWYLYTINGSDNVSDLSSYTSVYGYQNTAPMVDGIRGGGSSSIPRYAVSAWTPTVYLRALRGVKFDMQKADKYENSAWVHEPYTMIKMEAEAYQISDLKGVTLCGYVYWRRDESDFVNLAYDARLANIDVVITIEIDSTTSKTHTITTKTNAEGFYSVYIDSEFYGKTCSFEISLPNRNFTYSTKLNDVTEYHRISVSSVEASNNSITVSAYDVVRAQIYVRNCGLTKIR